MPMTSLITVTREMIRLTRAYLPKDLKFGGNSEDVLAGYNLSSPSPNGRRFIQRHIDALFDSSMMNLDIGEIAERYLAPSAVAFGRNLVEAEIDETFGLFVPQSGVIEAVRDQFDGLSMRSLICYEPHTDQSVIRYDVLFTGKSR